MVLKTQVGQFCPVAALQAFLRIRGKDDEPPIPQKEQTTSELLGI